MNHRHLPTASLAVVAALLLCACTTAPTEPEAAPVDGDGHGAVSGAAELGEPALGLTTVDDTGAVRHLDLLDEQVTETARIDDPQALTTDGRYLFVQTPDGVTIIDSGRWTWDHVDHFHYYEAEPKVIGTVAGGGPVTVATTNSSTTGGVGLSFAESGDAVLLDVEALSRGELVESVRLEREPHDGLAVPVGSFLLATDPGAASVVAHTSAGEPIPAVEADCAEPRGTITTRVGAVIGCADGALLATVRDGDLGLEKIPYPEGVSRVDFFANREGRPTVAGLADPSGIRLLDTRARAWTILTSPVPLVQVTAVDDDADHVLGLTEDGRVLVLDGADGELLATTEPLVEQSLASGAVGVTLIADQQRAYLNGPAERRLFEIDFADGARIARTFETATDPAFVAETGR